MEKLDRLKLFITIHKGDIGMFAIRIALSFVFVSHSALQLTNVLPGGLTTVTEVSTFVLSMIELIASIMILSGFLVCLAGYSLIILIAYYAIVSNSSIYAFLFENSGGHTLLVIAACIGVSFVGPGKIVMSRRYGHIISSSREDGVDKEIEIMGT